MTMLSAIRWLFFGDDHRSRESLEYQMARRQAQLDETKARLDQLREDDRLWQGLRVIKPGHVQWGDNPDADPKA